MNCRTVSKGRLRFSTFLLLSGLFLSSGSALTQEFRALWADTFHAGMRNSAEVSQLVADARAGNFNAIIVEVRKRGDAYYNSNFEPKATDVSPQSFDPLADLVAKAHNTGNGPRIEVHAWIVTFNIWNNETTPPPQATHPYQLHPDWVTRSSSGTTWDGSNYAFDPGHPEVQKHTFNVAMDIVSRYNMDGLHFDYIRYAGNTWGYNAVALNRFKARFNRTGTPSATDPQWLQFRRDQVTSLVRKIYLSAIAVKPLVKISASTITWAPGITTDAQWPTSAAYSSVLQDWRAWMQEGILDLNVPMAYFRQPVNGTDWANWSIFAKNHRYNRHLSLGSGIYLNSVSDALAQMRSTRTATSTGYRADGVTGYSYAVTSNDGVPRSTFFSALTQPSAFDPNPTPIFSTPVPTPAMSWKTAPTLGHLKGIVTRAANAAGIDGAGLALNGPANRALLADATGFYGAVDLPPGDYTLTASFTNLEPKTVQLTITAGAVINQDFNLAVPPGAGFFSNVLVSPGARGAIVTWNTTGPTMSQVEFGTSTNYGRATHLDENLATNHSMLLPDLVPNTNYFFRLVARTETNELRSGGFFFQTAGDLILDNPEAGFSGGWTIATSSTDKYSTNYHYAGTATGGATATATFTPDIVTPGKYDVYVWYPQGGNRSTNAPFLATYNGGSLITRVNQTTGGGAWQLIAGNRNFSSGTGGYARLSNDTGETGKIVVADAVRFVYATNQDPPPPGTVPEWWATHYFGSNVNGSIDHDGDGFSAYAEFVTGTAPDDAGSRLRLGLETDAQGNRLAIFSPYLAGRLYRLQSRADFGTTNWTTLTNLTPSTNLAGEGVITDTNTAGAQNYYRLRIELVP